MKICTIKYECELLTIIDDCRDQKGEMDFMN